MFSLFLLTTLLGFFFSSYRYFPNIAFNFVVFLLCFYYLFIDFWIFILLFYTYFGFNSLYSSIFSIEVYSFDLRPSCIFSRSNFSNKSCFCWIPHIFIGYVSFPFHSKYFLIYIVISSLFHGIFRIVLHYLQIVIVF